MRIGTKLIISLAVPLIALMVVFGYVDQRKSRAQLREELKREGRAVARTIQLALEDALRDRQLDDARELADQVSDYERILGIRVFDRGGALVHQSPSLEPYPFQQNDALQTALTEQRTVETYRAPGGQSAVSFIAPLVDNRGAVMGAVQVLQLESYIDEDMRSSRRSISVLTAIMILGMIGIILLVTRLSVSRPVEDLVRDFREVGSGGQPAQVSVRRHDEFGRLAREFRRMWQQLDVSRHSLIAEQEGRRRMEAQLRNADRLASLGRLSAGLAHEIDTPLNVIRGRAEQLERGTNENDPRSKHLRTIVGQIDRIARIVHGMLDFARNREPRLAATDVPAVLHKVLDFVGQRFESSGVRLEVEVQKELPAIFADADALHQVFLNLTTNALDAMPAGGTLRVKVERTEASRPERPGPAESLVAVRFEDTGHGIQPQNLDRLFDPFFTTKEVGKGTGLGLSIAYGIVQEHGGWIAASNNPERGATLVVYLPSRSPASHRQRAGAAREA